MENVESRLFWYLEMPNIAQVIGMVLCGQLIIYWVSYFFLKSKY